MSNPPAIEVSDLVKRFRREMLVRDYGTWKSLLLRPFSRQRRRDLVTVLDGVRFSVDPGRTLAIIGQNGSGKSTLLKILAGIYKPDAGVVKVRGRVSSLIELGAGFHPEFSGRENVQLNATILGLSKKEIAERFEHIVAYSGLGEYIDAPVRTYSSGMYVRLGFSVAVNVDPDVLLVDEVLAVGDEAFAHKCEDKVNEFRRAGKTIVLVTHDLGAVEKYADEVIWLDGGCVAAHGEPKPVIDAYRQKVAAQEDEIRRDQCVAAGELKQERWGDGDVVIEAVRVLDAAGGERAVFQHGESLTLEIDYRQVKPTEDLVFGVAVSTAQGVLCYGSNTHIDRVELGAAPLAGTVRLAIERLDLVQGTYLLDAAAHAKDGRAYDYIKQIASFAVRSSVGDEGVFRPPHHWTLTPRGEA
ncbi:MAG: ABC transporter ATP-binding protein [Desulfarculus sp.]|nr:ABC transporter ATP-binding protein [Desulfarculus sp.]